jgi:hypothetical protein
MPISFWRRKVTKTASGPVGPYLTHSGVVAHQNNFWAGRAVFISFRHRKVTQTASGPVGPYLTHSGVDGHQDHIWAGRAVSIPLRCRRVAKNTFRPVTAATSFQRRKVTQTDSGPDWLCLSHSGVDGSPKHFKAGEAASTSFRRLLGRSGCIYLTPASKGHPKHF